MANANPVVLIEVLSKLTEAYDRGRNRPTIGGRRRMSGCSGSSRIKVRFWSWRVRG